MKVHKLTFQCMHIEKSGNYKKTKSWIAYCVSFCINLNVQTLIMRIFHISLSISQFANYENLYIS